LSNYPNNHSSGEQRKRVDEGTQPGSPFYPLAPKGSVGETPDAQNGRCDSVERELKLQHDGELDEQDEADSDETSLQQPYSVHDCTIRHKMD